MVCHPRLQFRNIARSRNLPVASYRPPNYGPYSPSQTIPARSLEKRGLSQIGEGLKRDERGLAIMLAIEDADNASGCRFVDL